MNNHEVALEKKEILQKLTKRQLKSAIDQLRKLINQTHNSLFFDKLEEIETNYKYMLHYQFEGIDDPEQKNVYSSFIRNLFELTDDVSDELFMADSPKLFFEKSRTNAIRGNLTIAGSITKLKDLYASLTLTDLDVDEAQKIAKKKELSVQTERIASDMFLTVYTSKRADNNDLNAYNEFISSSDVREQEKCLFISALTLNLFHRFDARKLKLLMDCCLDDNSMISQRAIVGLVIFLQMNDIRWHYYAECQQQLDTLSENSYFKKSVITIIKQLIRSRETEKISKKLTEEIIPEMMKFNSLAGKKLNMDDLMGLTDDFSEKNPEWKKELENSGLADKLQEYSNLQMEGADVFHSTFSNLKSFPFFYDMSNWFLPFTPSYSELLDIFAKSDKDSLLYTAVVASNHMCDSDKYSFCFSLLQMPEMQRNMMLQRFGAESEEMKQLQKEAMEMNSSANEEVISNQYIQDLYRFFKVHPSKNSFFDIFSLPINFYSKKSIAPLISDVADMQQIALYCFDKNFLSEALNIYLLMIEKDVSDSGIWQKIGYCKQMLGDNDGALDAYLQADLVTPNNTWTMRRIAQLYRSKKQFNLALSYFLKLQSTNNDNISIELNIGHCYLDVGEYDKALNTYFKVELLDGGDNPKSWRPIAWTAFLLGKNDLAQNYYNRILSQKPTEHDYLNAGHVELVLKNRKKALEHYSLALRLLEDNTTEFQNLFLSDQEVLIKAGIDENFFPLLFDELNYNRQK